MLSQTEHGTRVLALSDCGWMRLDSHGLSIDSPHRHCRDRGSGSGRGQFGNSDRNKCKEGIHLKARKFAQRGFYFTLLSINNRLVFYSFLNQIKQK